MINSKYLDLLDKEYIINDGFTIEKHAVSIPSFYYGSAFSVNFLCDVRKLESYIDRIQHFRPIKILPQYALVNITIFNFIDSPVGPYLELVISIPISNHSRLHSLIDLFRNQNGFCVLDIFQSTEIAVKHGNMLTGYPHNSKLINGFIETNLGQGTAQINVNDGAVIDFKFDYDDFGKIVHNSYPTYYESMGDTYKIEMDIHGMEHKSKLKGIKIGENNLSKMINEIIVDKYPIRPRFYIVVLEVNPVSKMKIYD